MAVSVSRCRGGEVRGNDWRSGQRPGPLVPGPFAPPTPRPPHSRRRIVALQVGHCGRHCGVLIMMRVPLAQATPNALRGAGTRRPCRSLRSP